MRIRVKTKKKLNKKLSVLRLKKEADRVFSLWIRARDNHICFTCNRKLDPKQSQNGHYVSRSHNSLRYDERNCHVQCMACNVFKHGAMDVYALKLIAKYGDNILIDLQREKNKVKQWTIKGLQELIERYTMYV